MKKLPKDRQIIIKTYCGDRVAIWSPADEKFVFANVQIDLYEGKWDMYYFENEYIKESDILEWRGL